MRRLIVCLCGSTKFKDAYMDANFHETMEGKIVLSVCSMNNDIELTHYEKKRLDDLHKDKIFISDEVLFLNVDGYMGESTLSELEYARSLGKVIRFLEPLKGNHGYI